jgi:hypothetical protein
LRGENNIRNPGYFPVCYSASLTAHGNGPILTFVSEENKHERVEPYTKQAPRSTGPKSNPQTLTAIILGAVLLAGVVFAGLKRSAVPAQAQSPTPISAPAPAPAPTPAPPPPAPAPVDAMTRFKSCKPYAAYELDTHSASVDAQQLLDEASCLCALAGAYTVRLPPGGIQQFKGVAACPAGSAPMPLAPDAKQWKGEWIDEPGHSACVCSTDVRELKPAVIKR